MSSIDKIFDAPLQKYVKTDKEKNELFNRFQKDFYTNIEMFSRYTNFEYNKMAFLLIQNMGKGLPSRANVFFKLRGFNFDYKSPELLRALQRKFVNNYQDRRVVPSFIYFKSNKDDKLKNKSSRVTEKGIIFSMDITIEICRVLKIDSKTYDYIKFTKEIQDLGKQFSGDFMNKEKIKKSKK